MKIYFYKGKSIVSTLIKWFTQSKYSHVAVEVDGVTYEARFSFRILWKERKIQWIAQVVSSTNPLHYHSPGTEIDTYEVPLTDVQNEFAKNRLEKMVGTPYDFGLILGFFTGNNYSKDGKVICSELVYELLDMLDKIYKYNDKGVTSPGRLSTMMSGVYNLK